MRKLSKHLQSGFTLIEVMVVVAIIGILALVIVPNVVGKDDQARVTTTKASLSSVANALELYKLDNYRYPSTEEGLEALVRRPASARIFPDGGYLRRLPTDSWDNPMQYASPGSAGRPYDLYSLGADNAEGGAGFAADIYFE
ncbi:MAG: type II secretion system major pseudopilin GspG [Moraxellaceae bacterium]|nr:type II secretion system major pseudopilin GspG [Moraxellaceae bacterium]MDZ4387140.1 type II secretion system major pseudopilin GspG [Moraxellaceae bacterium]